VHLGVLYTRYSFNSDLRGDELFLGDVPLMVPLSYTFMAYFAFSAGRMLASGPWRTRASHRWHEWLLALILAVWALWILDPVSRRAPLLSRRAVPVQGGRGSGSGCRSAARSASPGPPPSCSRRFTLSRDEPPRPVDGILRHPRLPALITYNAQVAHLAIVALVIGGIPADTIGGSCFLMWIPAAAITAVLWSTLHDERARSERPPERARVPQG
jgi:hypothetical protein